MVQIAIYKFLRGDYKESLAGFADAYKRDQDPYDGLHAALIAAQLDDFDMQNQMLLAIIREGDAAEKAKARPGHVQLANLIVVGLLKRNSERPLDIEQADKIILDASARESNNLNYVVGKWLWLHGQEDDALKYLKTAAQSTRFNRNYSRYLAAAFLHDEGVDFSEGRNSD